MGPADAATLTKLFFRWIDELRAADLLKTVRGELGNDQVASLVKHPYPVIIPHHMNIRPASPWNGVMAHPYSVAGQQIEAAELAVAVHAVDVLSE